MYRTPRSPREVLNLMLDGIFMLESYRHKPVGRLVTLLSPEDREVLQGLTERDVQDVRDEDVKMWATAFPKSVRLVGMGRPRT